jgi:hypothetical protein|tara:strand:- start:846 stop:1112 length:267 start_codon:yes stop_codon:yes gene_type:complete
MITNREMATKSKKYDNFVRLATKRTNVILSKIRILGNCANRSAYQYSEDDVNKIFNEIEKVLKLTKSKFRVERGEFTLRRESESTVND